MSKKKTAKEWLKKNWKWLAASAGAITLGAIKVVLDSSSDNTDVIAITLNYKKDCKI